MYMSSPTPTHDQDELLRLEALNDYELIDTPPEADFDDLVQLASQICGTPMALISLIDDSRQWFKAKVGTEIESTPREIAFCRYTIQYDNVLVVPDTKRDVRFVDNPMVTGSPGIRFYAGAPLITPSKQRIGTLCVIDHRTRELSQDQQHSLAALSRQVITQMELRRTVRRLSNSIIERDSAIHQSRQSNDKLLAQNTHHSSIMAALSEGIVVQTLERGIESFNPSACRILGLTGNQLTGLDSLDPRWAAIHEDGSPFPGDTHPAMVTLRTGRPCTDVIMGLRIPDSGLRWVSINTRLMPQPEGVSARKAVVSFHEVTELLRVQHELASARDLADAANRFKSQFLANMSHEIRTPMTAILGFADVLREPTLTARDKDDCIETILRNGAHLITIIDDILDLSKLEARKMTIEKVAVEPAKIVDEVASLMRMRASERGLGFAVSYGHSIPAVVQTDPTRLRQILINLVGNAIKFTPAGGIKVEVSMSEGRTGRGRLQFAVIDTGVGMTEEQVARLFEPFSQADPSTTRVFGGTGLGLAICRGLAEQMGGEIRVQSDPGRGSQFTLSIDPWLAASETESDVTPPGDPLPNAGPFSLRARILLAEDGVDNQRLISHFLRHAGAEVVVTENGKVAVETALAGRFDLILMDLQMPVMDGRTATTTLRAAGWTGPIVALTAHAFIEERQACLAAGFSGFLAKPINRELLIREVQDSLPKTSGRAECIRSQFANQPVMAELLNLYVADLPGIVSDIDRLMAGNDVAGLQIVAHRLRGSGGGYGFPQISAAAAALEDQLKTQSGLSASRGAADALAAVLQSVEGYGRASHGS